MTEETTSNYKQLRAHFESLPAEMDRVEYTFAELEAHASRSLQSAARHQNAKARRGWWVNSPQQPYSAWSRAGWLLDHKACDFASEKLVFIRGVVGDRKSKSFHQRTEDGPEDACTFQGFSWTWKQLGTIKPVGNGLTFPGPSQSAYWGLYRIRLPDRVYVGQTFHFRWRWVQYDKGLVFDACRAANAEVPIDTLQSAKLGDTDLDLQRAGNRVLLEAVALYYEHVICERTLLNAGNLFMRD